MVDKSDQDNLIKAVMAKINLGDASLDVYMLPSGEKRIGVENIGLALGYSKRFFFQRTKRQSKTLKALQAQGFSGEQKWVKIIRQGDDIRGATIAKTVSIRDFTKLVTFEAVYKRKLEAIILLAALAETGIERIIDDVFEGRSVDFILDKIVHYSQWTYEELEEVLAYNREEARSLYWGYEPNSPSLEL